MYMSNADGFGIIISLISYIIRNIIINFIPIFDIGNQIDNYNLDREKIVNWSIYFPRILIQLAWLIIAIITSFVVNSGKFNVFSFISALVFGQFYVAYIFIRFYLMGLKLK